MEDIKYEDLSFICLSCSLILNSTNIYELHYKDSKQIDWYCRECLLDILKENNIDVCDLKVL